LLSDAHDAPLSGTWLRMRVLATRLFVTL